MATLKEIFGEKTRGDGRRLGNRNLKSHQWFEPIFLSRATWYGIDQDGVLMDWRDILGGFFEIKKTKKIKMYSPIIAGYEKNYCSQGEWHTDKTNWAKKPEIKGWLEMEVEVEE